MRLSNNLEFVHSKTTPHRRVSGNYCYCFSPKSNRGTKLWFFSIHVRLFNSRFCICVCHSLFTQKSLTGKSKWIFQNVLAPLRYVIVSIPFFRKWFYIRPRNNYNVWKRLRNVVWKTTSASNTFYHCTGRYPPLRYLQRHQNTVICWPVSWCHCATTVLVLLATVGWPCTVHHNLITPNFCSHITI